MKLLKTLLLLILICVLTNIPKTYADYSSIESPATPWSFGSFELTPTACNGLYYLKRPNSAYYSSPEEALADVLSIDGGTLQSTSQPTDIYPGYATYLYNIANASCGNGGSNYFYIVVRYVGSNYGQVYR